MDSYREHPDAFDASQAEPATAADAGFEIGTDERRMHVRAYNYWCSLLNGRDYPSIEDLEPRGLIDFSDHSVLLDFTSGQANPATSFIGAQIRQECDLGDDKIQSIEDVPTRSLLTRLTDHYMQIIANRAPVGFEAEFVNQRGHSICYRGILMPFSSDGDTIDFIYGVINWKDAGSTAQPVQPLRAVLPPIDLEDEIDEDEDPEIAEVSSEPEPEHLVDEVELSPHMIWEDGPLADGDAIPEISIDEDAGLADRLSAARESAEVCKAQDGRSRAALYRALAMAYDFSVAAKRVPDDYCEILDDAGVKAQARAPMTPIVKLVFGVDYDKARLTEFAAALSNAERNQVDFGGFQAFLDSADGGLKGLVAAERKARRPAAPELDKAEAGRAALRAAPPIPLWQLPTNEEFALVLTRRNADGIHEVVQLVSDAGTLDRLIRRAA
jgi:hypothetical protein